MTADLTLQIEENYSALSRAAARLVIRQLEEKPDSNLVFATGKTPLGMFDELAAAYQQGRISFENASLVELDDYYGIPLEDPRNLFNWLRRDFLDRVEFPLRNTARFLTDTSAPVEECARIEQFIAASGGIDLQVLGLGPNGHLGFNEPGSALDSGTRVVRLAPASLESSQRYWGEQPVPEYGLTLGLGTLAAARKTLLLVSGGAKAGILHKVLSSPLDPCLPATALHTFPDVLVLADREAAGALGD